MVGRPWGRLHCICLSSFSGPLEGCTMYISSFPFQQPLQSLSEAGGVCSFNCWGLCLVSKKCSRLFFWPDSLKITGVPCYSSLTCGLALHVAAVHVTSVCVAALHVHSCVCYNSVLQLPCVTALCVATWCCSCVCAAPPVCYSSSLFWSCVCYSCV